MGEGQTLFFSFLRIIYLFMRDTQRRQRHKRRKKQAPCREPDVGLDPGTLGSRPEPKADAQPLSHPGVPGLMLLMELPLMSLIAIPEKLLLSLEVLQ